MHDRHKRGLIPLSLGISVITIVWIIVLPRIASWKSVRENIDLLDRKGIDPAALYYTDVEAMARIEADMNAARQSHPEAFWSVRSAEQ